jgi:hypothetical protein
VQPEPPICRVVVAMWLDDTADIRVRSKVS